MTRALMELRERFGVLDAAEVPAESDWGVRNSSKWKKVARSEADTEA